LLNTHKPSLTLLNTHKPSLTLLNTHKPSLTLLNTHKPSLTLLNTHKPSPSAQYTQAQFLSHNKLIRLHAKNQPAIITTIKTEPAQQNNFIIKTNVMFKKTYAFLHRSVCGQGYKNTKKQV
jgi:hypothetical protein